jgi:hypothetical protein
MRKGTPKPNKKAPTKAKPLKSPEPKQVKGPAAPAKSIPAAPPPPPPGPTRQEVKPQVIDILTNVANPASLPVGDESKDLTADHGITDTGKENLAPSFSRISRDKYHGLTTSRADSKKCKTVGDSIDLVFKRSNNNPK